MNEDKTSTNDEVLEDNETEHDNSTTEGEDEASEEQADRTYTRAELEERLEQERKERDKRWRDRIKKASGEDHQEDSQKSGKEGNSEKVTSNESTIARLEARGILDKEIQDYLFTAAKREGASPVDLLEDSYFKDRIAAMKKDKEQEAARPAPSQRTGTSDRSQDLGYWLKQAEKGVLPDEREMRKKVIAKLAGR